MTFATVDVSPVTPEGLRHVTAHSAALGRRADLTVWVPPGDDPVGVVTLLHGVYGSHWGWAHHGGAHRRADDLVRTGQIPPVALAMPSDGLWGHGSGYVRHDDADYEAWIVDEVPALVAECGVRSGDGRALIGLSMGGFGALRLGLRHASTHCAAVGLSAITNWASMATFVGDLSRYPAPDDPDIAALAAATARPPALRLDCGEDDVLLEENRALHRALCTDGVPHEYEEHRGAHDWTYWAARVGPALEFVGRHLGDER